MAEVDSRWRTAMGAERRLAVARWDPKQGRGTGVAFGGSGSCGHSSCEEVSRRRLAVLLPVVRVCRAERWFVARRRVLVGRGGEVWSVPWKKVEAGSMLDADEF